MNIIANLFKSKKLYQEMVVAPPPILDVSALPIRTQVLIRKHGVMGAKYHLCKLSSRYINLLCKTHTPAAIAIDQLRGLWNKKYGGLDRIDNWNEWEEYHICFFIEGMGRDWYFIVKCDEGRFIGIASYYCGMAAINRSKEA